MAKLTLPVLPSRPPSSRLRRHWLIKSEPETFSWDDLWRSPKRTVSWDGVRNYQARNLLRDGMKRGDLVFFYHSNADPPAIVGIARITREGYPDATAFDSANPHFDAKASRAAPTWIAVDVAAVQPLARPVSLGEMRRVPSLAAMSLFTRPRLSVQPVTPREWATVLKLASRPASL
ncbi:MAG: EVE domain-containing protein [Gemmatimonadaceae bacterium]